MVVPLEFRAARLAALADPVRLAMVDALAVSDLAPVELRQRVGVESNLLAHHLDVLETAGLVHRSRSSGDGRRRYVRLIRAALGDLLPGGQVEPDAVLFVCTHNSARSQLAAAVWNDLAGGPAASAGTHPAARVHPGAVAAARRAGLDLRDARPRTLDGVVLPELVVTVCDRAHEELAPAAEAGEWWHWSIADPVPDGRAAAFDAVVDELRTRITAVTAVAA